MKNLKLYEAFNSSRPKTKPSIIIDGTSSSGKSTMTKVLKDSGWITICGNDFF